MRRTRYIYGNKGFTLLEMIIVLFLISLILGIATIFFANALPSNQFNATVRNISATIRQARSLAQIHNKNQTVTIDLDSRIYDLSGRPPREIPSGVSVKVIDPMLGEILEGKYRFTLYPSGVMEGGTVVLWSSKKKASIAMDPVVGTIVIK